MTCNYTNEIKQNDSNSNFIAHKDNNTPDKLWDRKHATELSF